MSGPCLILASGSAVRRRLLEAAGVAFSVKPAGVDEPGVISAMIAGQATPRRMADHLAELKALRVSQSDGTALVLGADQVLALEGEIFMKPAGTAGAREHLRKLRGRTHELITASVLARGGTPVWRHVTVNRLTMRRFTDEFLEDYLAQAGEGIRSSVGAYLLEERGAQLFSRIDGDYFSILGLPLLPLLEALRTHEVLPS